jgi:glycerophosphoryl diester phosphodiesterase
MNWPYPRFLAHRGGGTLAPENTLVALDMGWQCGYRAAEVDAALTADEVPVLLHDATLERTTNGRGSLARTTAAALAGLDAGSWLDPQYCDARVPTLAEALQRCRERALWLNIEIKPVPGHEERTGAVVARTVADFWSRTALPSLNGPVATPLPLLSSFSHTALAAARRAAPGLRQGVLFTRVPADWPEVMRSLGAYSLHCDHRYLDARLARAITGAGFGLLCYTVNDGGRAQELLDWGVDAICTDRIDLIAPAEAQPAG